MSDLLISELTEISSLADDDLLVLQRGNNASYKMTFSDFKKAFEQKFYQLGVKTAGQCNAEQFAAFAHGHSYSDFWYFSSYGPQSGIHENQTGCSCVGKFNVVKYGPGTDQLSVHQLCCWQPPTAVDVLNEVSVYAPATHNAGDLEFIAAKDFQAYLTAYRKYELDSSGNIKLNPSSGKVFDGYVIPDGKTFTCSSSTFKKACQLYSSSHNANATSFTVPDFSGKFFRCDPGLASMTPLQQVASKAVMPQHNHGGTLKASPSTLDIELSNVAFELRGTYTSSPQHLNAVHQGAGKVAKNVSDYHDYVLSAKVYPALTNFDLTCNASGVKCSEYSEPPSEPYPDYMNVHVLLYIGLSSD